MPLFHRSHAPAWRDPASRVAALVLALAAPGTALAQPQPAPLSLAEAIGRASAADPAAAAVQARLDAARAGVRQASVRPNPTLGVELENFAGSGAYSLLDRTEATLSYQQTFERGGKRSARAERAQAEAALVQRRAEVSRLDLVRDVQVAYASSLAADAELLMAEARLIAAHQAQEDIDRRVKSARDPLFAASRAEAATAQAEITRDQAREAARAARAALAAFWGGAPDFSLNLDAFFNVQAPTGAGAPAAADLAVLEAERDVADASVRLERARGVADPTLRAGVRYLGDGDDVAFIVGGAIPLRRYDTNQAGVERAVAERTAAEADLVAARLLRDREIVRLTARLAASASESDRIRDQVIPYALRTVEQVRAGFNRGGFQYLDVTEAERALADTRARRVAVLRQHHLDQAALDRLTGAKASLIPDTTSAERR